MNHCHVETESFTRPPFPFRPLAGSYTRLVAFDLNPLNSYRRIRRDTRKTIQRSSETLKTPTPCKACSYTANAIAGTTTQYTDADGAKYSCRRDRFSLRAADRLNYRCGTTPTATQKSSALKIV